MNLKNYLFALNKKNPYINELEPLSLFDVTN